jgi:hypothetical protein
VTDAYAPPRARAPETKTEPVPTARSLAAALVAMALAPSVITFLVIWFGDLSTVRFAYPSATLAAALGVVLAAVLAHRFARHFEGWHGRAIRVVAWAAGVSYAIYAALRLTSGRGPAAAVISRTCILLLLLALAAGVRALEASGRFARGASAAAVALAGLALVAILLDHSGVTSALLTKAPPGTLGDILSAVPGLPMGLAVWAMVAALVSLRRPRKKVRRPRGHSSMRSSIPMA